MVDFVIQCYKIRSEFNCHFMKEILKKKVKTRIGGGREERESGNREGKGGKKEREVQKFTQKKMQTLKTKEKQKQ